MGGSREEACKVKIIRNVVVLFAMTTPSLALSGDVYIEGYYRSDGTYVRPHYRSAPDGYRWNNYGPSRNRSQLLNPRTRDNDGDGTPNYLDWDDDNDGIADDFDSSQYRFGR